MNLDYKLLAVAIAGIIIGTGSALGLSEPNSSDADNKAFCEDVEEGIEEQMNQGFVNCFEPSGDYFSVREDIENSTSISCICRKKVGDKVQQTKFVKPD